MPKNIFFVYKLPKISTFIVIYKKISVTLRCEKQTPFFVGVCKISRVHK